MQSIAARAEDALKKTPLHDLHLRLGAKMVPFAGYEMPVQYADGVMKEHVHTRSSAGLFDVSHMGQAIVHAETDPAIALEKIVPGDIRNLKDGKMRYTVLLNEHGGIIDDLMVTRLDDKTLFIVVNAARKDVDFAYLRAQFGPGIRIEPLENRALLALQGPKAESVLAAINPDVADLSFMTMVKTNLGGVEAYISRSGYTGEDGFEISVPSEQAINVADSLLSNPDVKPIGLGARDSLRLEAGLCLYGHDMDEQITPIEANLAWCIQKSRRTAADFTAADTILSQLDAGTDKLRVGLIADDRAPVREGAEIFDLDGARIGIVTSGTFGPTIEKPVMMGYVEKNHALIGTRLQVDVRGNMRPVTVAAMPFVPTRYKK